MIYHLSSTTSSAYLHLQFASITPSFRGYYINHSLADAEDAYVDSPLPIGHHQTISAQDGRPVSSSSTTASHSAVVDAQIFFLTKCATVAMAWRRVALHVSLLR